MSDFIKKIKEEAQAVVAAIDQELTVLEGVDGYDALREDDAEASKAEGSKAEGSDADGSDAETPDTEPEDHQPSDDTEGGGTPM